MGGGAMIFSEKPKFSQIGRGGAGKGESEGR